MPLSTFKCRDYGYTPFKHVKDYIVSGLVKKQNLSIRPNTFTYRMYDFLEDYSECDFFNKDKNVKFLAGNMNVVNYFLKGK